MSTVQSASSTIVDIAIAVPHQRSFHYTAPNGMEPPKPGCRVLVPLGKRQLIGLMLADVSPEQTQSVTLRPIIKVLDDQPLLPSWYITWLTKIARYYHCSLSVCLYWATPKLLWRQASLTQTRMHTWSLAPEYALKKPIPVNAHRQQAVIAYLEQHSSLLATELSGLGIQKATLHTLCQKGYVTQSSIQSPTTQSVITPAPFTLTDEQQAIITAYQANMHLPRIALLEGVTGSGKTEVYFQLITKVIAQGKQAMLLVPEIGLTAGLIEQIKARFSCLISIFHSHITDAQRLLFWQQTRTGQASIILGTRSAVFTPTCNLGLIIVDEEHDASYKQQDKLAYHARDVACLRGQIENIPVILGSATPSLESLANSHKGHYLHWTLSQRTGTATLPSIHRHDIRGKTLHDGICEEVLADIQQTLARNEQALVFLNRRGFAKQLLCRQCGFIDFCDGCERPMTVHLQNRSLRCHHCGTRKPIPTHCPQCHASDSFDFQGLGTERLASSLHTRFNNVPLFRIDRDTVKNQKTMEITLANIKASQACIVVGTQMLAKGHHLPDITLVVVLESDNSLAATDLRGQERLAQTLTQVVGRAGRATKPGKAIIQTLFPNHPLFIALFEHGYQRFASDTLAERYRLSLPPFSYQALVRIEDKNSERARQTLQSLTQHINATVIEILGPYPAPIQRRAFYFRYHLLLQSPNRAALHHAVSRLLAMAPSLVTQSQRFMIDIDPHDLS